MKRLNKRFSLLALQTNQHNAKEYSQSFITKKNTKPVKQSEVITCQQKALENSNIVNKKPVITEYPKT